jgi:nicotinamidase-related amidase
MMRIWGVDTAVIAGITTNVCVLMTALDAVQNDFRSVIVSDACACHEQAIHDNIISMYANTLMVPLLRILSASELISELKTHYAQSV